jgi:HK97 family phage major capsid protein
MHISSRFLFGATMEETLIFQSGEVKALGNGKVGGYLIRFTSENEPDLEGDYFADDTYYGKSASVDVYYQHGLDGVLKRRVIGEAALEKKDAGVWAEAQLELRDEYERAIYELAEAGKLGWSSGTAGHLMERDGSKITRWPIVEASLTPTPAEPRNSAIPLKSLITPESAVRDGDTKTNSLSKDKNMENQELLDALKAHSEETAQNAAQLAALKAEEAVEQKLAEFKASLPDITAGVEVKKDAADNQQEGNPLHGAEFFKAVKHAAQGVMSPRFQAYLKAAQGMNEAIPSQGGFVVPPEDTKPMLERMYNVGEVLSRVQRDPVSGNGMKIPAIDETSRVDGSRQGGVRGYWIAEAGSITSSKPKFREIALDLKKVAALVYATDEMLEDVNFMQSWLGRTVPDELRFLTEDAIYEGDGVGKPLGWMNSAAKVEVTRLNASEINFEDIVNMWARRWAGVNDYVWYVNQDAMPQLDQLYLTAGTAGIPPRFVDYDSQGIMRMKGAPVFEVEYAATLGTAGDILLVSPSQYQLIEKASGIQSASSIHVQFDTAETAFRFIYRVDGEPTWNSALTPFKGSNTQTPIVALSASS